MAGGLVALLDDIAALAKLAAASIDDVSAAAGRAGVKAAGVVIDDTAVTPRYVVGLSPDRELPIIGKIALGSIANKLLLILPLALLLSAFAPWALTPILMLGGAYLCFEAAEKILEALKGEHHADEVAEITDAKALEKRQVLGAIRTDLILSAEIMVIALSQLPAEMSVITRAGALVLVAFAITVGVYGVVALIVKMDDIGLHFSRNGGGATAALGRGLVRAMPLLLSALSHLGVAAMVWVGGGILLHGMEEFGFGALPHAVHHWSEAAGAGLGGVGAIVTWAVYALGSAIAGLVVGSIIVLLLHLLPHKGH